ncbi:hypothetical protein [Pseudomonas jinjuensis]|uniref:hypothetical protein n=1 Tax=Pseudomonas jinjuensis TaxID=198616 RepID=UPI00146FAD1B|nr:hypothetical protein [Pseudomonas jinjuensis]
MKTRTMITCFALAGFVSLVIIPPLAQPAYKRTDYRACPGSSLPCALPASFTGWPQFP